jgi:hypothetical protein
MKLTSAARAAIPTSKFALPKQRKFPIENASHAANAKSRAAQQYAKGSLSLSELGAIRSKANRVLAK